MFLKIVALVFVVAILALCVYAFVRSAQKPDDNRWWGELR